MITAALYLVLGFFREGSMHVNKALRGIYSLQDLKEGEAHE